MSISNQSVTELRKKCGLSVEKCRAALKKHGGDVDAALAGLIEGGQVKSDNLNPETVSDELFERAAHHEQLEMYRSLGSIFENLAKKLAGDVLPPELLQQLGEKFNKPPEELLAADEKLEAKRREQLARVLPELSQNFITAGQQARLHAETLRRSKWLKAHPFTLRLPPFPPLKRGMSEWTGRDVLSAWAGTQERHGGYTSLSISKPSKGTVLLDIPRLGEDDANPRPPSPEQVAAYKFLKDNQVEVTAIIIKALLKDYATLRRRWLKNNPKLQLPEITSVGEIRKNIGLGTLHMHPIAKDGFAYIGLELGCTWDEEHGAGVLLHCGRIVDIGQADMSFNSHAAIADGGVELQ